MPESPAPTQRTGKRKEPAKAAARTRGADATDIQMHYDLSNEFYRLWQDSHQVYSCAYFERDDMTLDEAQTAKVDLALGKLGLQPGMTLLDIGCGWGYPMLRAIERYDVNVIGLTLAHNQKSHVEQLFAQHKSPRTKEVRLQSWEEFDQPVDRIVSIGAFEHFGYDKYDDFFDKTYALLTDDGVMLLHTIVIPSEAEAAELQLKMTITKLRFIEFIMDEIFPGGRLPRVARVKDHAAKAGFHVTGVQHLQPHYARTLDTWAANPAARKDDAVALTSVKVYDTYMRYLTGCADLFRERYTDVCQFTCEKSKA